MSSNQPIKILKRQPNSTTTGNDINKSTAAIKPVRTLEEREAAYAEARRRILGSSPPEENLESTSTPIAQTNTTSVSTPTVVTIPTMAPQQRNSIPQNIPFMGRNFININRTVFIPQGIPGYPTHLMQQHHPAQPFYYYHQ